MDKKETNGLLEVMQYQANLIVQMAALLREGADINGEGWERLKQIHADAEALEANIEAAWFGNGVACD
jgi:hypothetical protein